MSFTKTFLIRVLCSGSSLWAHKLLYDLQNKEMHISLKKKKKTSVVEIKKYLWHHTIIYEKYLYTIKVSYV